jgi:hypothetical protein
MRYRKEDQNSPEGDELETPYGQTIITRRRLVATRADRGCSLPRPHVHFEGLVIRVEAGVLVDEPPMVLAVV